MLNELNEFLKTKRSLQDSHYEELAIDVLKMISFSSFIDGKVSENEKNIFEVFLASANIDDTRKKSAQQHLKTGAKLFGDDVSKKCLNAN
jgi:hypothetical protein